MNRLSQTILFITFFFYFSSYALTTSIGMSGGYLTMDDSSLGNGYIISGRVTLLPVKYLGIYGEYGIGRGYISGDSNYSISPVYAGVDTILPAKRWLSIFADIGFGYTKSVKIISVAPVSKFSMRIGGGISFFQNIRYPIYFGFGFFRSFIKDMINSDVIKFKSIDNMQFSAFVGYNL